MLSQTVLDFLPILLKGALVTIEVTIYSFLLSSLLGLVLALMKVSRLKPVSLLGATIVNIIRGLPIIVQLFYIYFVLPEIGIQLSAFQAGVIGLGIAYSAYQAENFRAGIEAVDVGQIEAAQCLGLSTWRIRWHVMLQPAIERVYPALTSQFLLMMQASAMASQISAEELTAIANTVQSDTFRSLETYIVVALLYLVLAVLVKLIAHAVGETIFKRRRTLRRAAAQGRRSPVNDPPGTVLLVHTPYVHAAVRLRARTGGRVS
jgi:polar amino acid transport system permease protein